jgi:Anti-sigma-K factor rskA
VTGEPTPQEVRELLGAYALNAIDPDERAQVDELLLSDASARAELHELEHAAAWLGHASLRPPAGAWDAIASEVARDLDASAATQAAATDAAAVVPVAASNADPTVRAIRPERRVSRWLVAAAAVVVLAIGGGTVIAIANRSGSQSVSDRAAAAQRSSSARTVRLHSIDGRWSARAVVLPNGTGYMLDASMPPVPEGRALQLWSITPSGPVSAGVLHGGVQQFHVAGASTALAVTEEPHGGSRRPSGSPIVSGELA